MGATVVPGENTGLETRESLNVMTLNWVLFLAEDDPSECWESEHHDESADNWMGGKEADEQVAERFHSFDLENHVGEQEADRDGDPNEKHD